MDADPNHAEPSPSAPNADEPLNLKQVARLLDVHYMTVYRYVRHGRLPAHRQGPIWLVERADAEAFRDGAASGTAPATGAVDWTGRLAVHLVDGDEVGGWTVLRDALASGRDLTQVHLDVLAGALARIGLDVAGGSAVPAQERVAVATAWRLVARLGGQFPHRGRKRGALVLASPPGEHHGLPLALVANLLRHAGYRVVELGTDTPAADVLDAVAATDHLVALGIGVTTVDRLDAARALIAAVRAAHPSLPVLLGGQAVRNAEVAVLAGACSWSAGPDLIATVHELAAARAAVPADR